MKLAVNYSDPVANLLRDQQIQIDYFKCPAWPDLVATVQKIHPTYVHFPLRVGAGIGDAIDTETKQLPDWNKVETLLNRTDTPLVNLHLSPTVQDYPNIPVDTTDLTHINMLVESMVKDVEAVARRFGSEHVIIENDHDFGNRHLRPAFLPEVICRVVEETDCGFLLDISHARLAAYSLGINIHEYISALPVSRIREIHITGVQRLEGHWIERMLQAGVDAFIIQRFTGRLVDHLPMTGKDWDLFAWSMEQIHSGMWKRPWVVAFEYGGVSSLHAAITEIDVLANQIPQLYTLIKEG